MLFNFPLNHCRKISFFELHQVINQELKHLKDFNVYGGIENVDIFPVRNLLSLFFLMIKMN